MICNTIVADVYSTRLVLATEVLAPQNEQDKNCTGKRCFGLSSADFVRSGKGGEKLINILSSALNFLEQPRSSRSDESSQKCCTRIVTDDPEHFFLSAGYRSV